MTDTLRTPIHNGHLMVAALKRHRDKPVMHLGETTLTGGQTADQISRYVQAFEALGAGAGEGAALLALNRPEVLFILGAGQTQGYRRTSLHPLGSLDDHAYVINDAEITTLIIDPVFAERALGLLERCPGLRQVLTIGPVPTELAHVGTDLAASAAAYERTELVAQDLAPDHIVSIAYTGGTTGKPKGVIGTAQAMNTMSQVQLAEWEWPREPRFLMCTPLSHAGAAFFVPTVIQGGSLFVLPRFDPAVVLEAIERDRITATMLVPSMLYALMDHPDSHTRDLSSLETVYYGASAINPTRLREAIERFGPIFAQYYGQSEAPMVITYLARADHDRPPRAARVLRPAERLHPYGAARRRRRAGRRRGTGGDLRGRTVACRRLLEAARGDGRDVPGRLAAHRRRRARGRGRLLVHRRSHQGHDRDRRVQRLPARGRGRRRDPPRGGAGRGDRHPAREVRRSGDRARGAAQRRADEAAVAEITALVKERKGSLHAPKQVIAVDAIPLTGLGKPDKKALRAKFGQPPS